MKNKMYTATAYKWKRYRFYGAEFSAPTVSEVADKIDNWFYKLCTTNEVDEWWNNGSDTAPRPYSEPLLPDWVLDGCIPECTPFDEGEDGGLLQIGRLSFHVEYEKSSSFDGEPVLNLGDLMDEEEKWVYKKGGKL